MRALAVALAWVLTPALAWAAHYVFTPLTIPVAGVSTFFVNAFNQEGDFGGSYVLNGQTYTFAEYKGKFQTLPPIPNTNPPELAFPSTITLNGDIGGVYSGEIGFVFHNGTFIAPIYGATGYEGMMGRNSAGDMFITEAQGNGIYNSVLGRGRQLPRFSPPINSHWSWITSLNERGNVVGVSIDLNAFYCINYRCGEIVVPGAITAAASTIINDHDQVAGIVAGMTSTNPFLFGSGILTQYTLPRNYTQATVGGFGSDGTIGGTAADINGVERIFILKNGRFQFFGSFQQPSVTASVLGITANGSVGLVVYTNGNPAYYLATCKGSGC